MLTPQDDGAGKLEPAATPSPNELQLKAEPGDALLEPGRPTPAGDKPADADAPRARPLARGIVAALAGVALLGAGFAAGSNYPFGRSLGSPQPERSTDPMSGSNVALPDKLNKAIAEIGTLKPAIAALGAREKASEEIAARERAQVDAAMSDLARKLDHLTEQVSDQSSKLENALDSLKKASAPSHPAPANKSTQAAKHARRSHDAFDPSRDPTAPGAPRPLGSH